jgi:hypothetical protein
LDAEGGGGLGKVCCAAQLHPKRQTIANRNVNIWDTTDVDLLAVKTRRAGSLSRRRGVQKTGTGKFGIADP